jgi:hypothetical protein
MHATFPVDATNGSATAHSDPPVWPGLDVLEDHPGAQVLQDAPQRSTGSGTKHWTVARRTPWLTMAMLTVLVGSITWLAFQGPRPVSVPAVSPQPSAKKSSPANAAKKVIAPAPPTVSPAPVAPPEVKPAVPNADSAEIAALKARAAEQHLVSLTGAMVKELDKATTLGERLHWIDATEPQQESVKKFFEANHGKLNPVQLEPASGKVVLLPSGEEVQLFRLATASCREGALLQVREEDGHAKLRWGLFEQFHEKTYDRFLDDNARTGSGTGHWFTLLCQRAHSFDLKDPTKEQWICCDAQGSLSAKGTGQVYVNKDSPVGRMIDAKTQWGGVYLVELLVGKMDIDGHRLNVVLDCAGLNGGAPRG